ncbi:MAG: hypothetical protein H6701_12320 [Myxococcales bacterium]|nr:hypothetical protein [Myxococcales bacterium]MCB9553795.1 hypothetical protein [Myxococcales bacterium]
MRRVFAWLAAAASCAACGGESVEAQPVEVPVRLAAAPGPVVTDLGYTVRVTAARQVLSGFVFTRGGEAHAGWLGWLVGTAHAHPGHAAGGEARGELGGRFVVDWFDAGAPLGTAAILPGRLDGLDFGLGTATADALGAGDPLVGHNLYLEAEVSRDERRWTLSLAVPQDADKQVTGVVCPAEIAAGSTLALALRVQDPFEDDTVFDGIDFAAEDPDGDGRIGPDASDSMTNRVRRALQTHDHYEVVAGAGEE